MRNDKPKNANKQAIEFFTELMAKPDKEFFEIMDNVETKPKAVPREFELFYSGLSGDTTVRSTLSAIEMLANNKCDDEYIRVVEKSAYQSAIEKCAELEAENGKHKELYKEMYQGHVDLHARIASLEAKLAKAINVADQALRQWEMYVTDLSRNDLEEIIQSDPSNVEAGLLFDSKKILEFLKP